VQTRDPVAPLKEDAHPRPAVSLLVLLVYSIRAWSLSLFPFPGLSMPVTVYRVSTNVWARRKEGRASASPLDCAPAFARRPPAS